jgi:hypothetical protein
MRACGSPERCLVFSSNGLASVATKWSVPTALRSRGELIDGLKSATKLSVPTALRNPFLLPYVLENS